MERGSSSRGGGVFVSCGESLKWKLPWKSKARRRHKSSGAICDVTTTTFCPPIQKRAPRVGGFKYDPLSYARNFDDSAIDDVDEEELYSHGFTSRFAAPTPSKSSSTAATNIPCVK